MAAIDEALTIPQRLEALARDFDDLGDGTAQLEHVMDLGRALPPLPLEDQTDENRVRGCASRLWLVSKREPDGALHFRADSDALITRGLAAVTLQLVQGRRPDEILAFDLSAAFDRLGLPRLSMSRASGLAGLIARIRHDAEMARTA
jgi:cysteine desulfuration protein SufE